MYLYIHVDIHKIKLCEERVLEFYVNGMPATVRMLLGYRGRFEVLCNYAVNYTTIYCQDYNIYQNPSLIVKGPICWRP